jgi:hypothetical protein
MVMPNHVCPWGLKTKWLLGREGYDVDDHWLKTRDETEAFKSDLGVETTPASAAARTCPRLRVADREPDDGGDGAVDGLHLTGPGSPRSM